MADFYDIHLNDLLRSFGYDITKGIVDPEIYDLDKKYFVNKIKSTRLECANWHYNENSEYVEMFIKLFKKVMN